MTISYQSARWRRLRLQILRLDGWECQMCGAMLREGRSDKASTILRPAVVDHIIPHQGDPALFYETTNLWSLCSDCHDGTCQAIEKKHRGGQSVRDAKLNHRMVGIDGYPKPLPERRVG